MEQTPAPQNGEVINNNLVWAILTTIFCCIPLGIYAIVLATRVDGLVAAGKLDEARATAAKAKQWVIYTVVAGVITYIIVGVCYFFLIASVVGSAEFKEQMREQQRIQRNAR